MKYVYEEVSRTGPYARQAGTYTRYGDVLPLLTHSTTALLVFGSGEEVALEFDPSKLPPLPAGWTRDYFFLPKATKRTWISTRLMGSRSSRCRSGRWDVIPIPGHYPWTPKHMDYVLEYNTRHVSGNEAVGYSYRYPQGENRKH